MRYEYRAFVEGCARCNGQVLLSVGRCIQCSHDNGLDDRLGEKYERFDQSEAPGKTMHSTRMRGIE